MARNQSAGGSDEVRSPANQTAPELPAKTELEQFCEEVVASHLQIDLAKLRSGISTAGGTSSQVSGYSVTDILALVELIGQIVLKIMESCPERSSERLRSSIAAPTFWQRIRVKNIAKDFFDDAAQRCWREDSSAVGDCLIQCAGGVAAARVQQILAEVQADDNWLV
jgi:hypothetical protein